MRLIANLKQTYSDVKRLLIYASEDGVYLLAFDKEYESSTIWDYWVEKVEYAFEVSQEYGVDQNDWKEILDPLENCQPDWIEPVRVKGREIAKPEWGIFEKLIDGKWIDL